MSCCTVDSRWSLLRTSGCGVAAQSVISLRYLVMALNQLLVLQRGTFSLTTARSVILDDFGLGYGGAYQKYVYIHCKMKSKTAPSWLLHKAKS